LGAVNPVLVGEALRSEVVADESRQANAALPLLQSQNQIEQALLLLLHALALLASNDLRQLLHKQSLKPLQVASLEFFRYLLQIDSSEFSGILLGKAALERLRQFNAEVVWLERLKKLKFLASEFFEEELECIYLGFGGREGAILRECVHQHSELLGHVERLHEGVYIAGVAQVLKSSVARAGLPQTLPLSLFLNAHLADGVLVVNCVYFCCLHSKLGQRLHLVEEAFGVLAETAEPVLIGGVDLDYVAVAGTQSDSPAQGVSADVGGQLVDLFPLESLPVAQTDHEVLYYPEV
jgi:hypothetical protein